jgi:hypothetical protein
MTAPVIMPAHSQSPGSDFDDEPGVLEQVSAAGPVSPELALIDPVLRAQAIASYAAPLESRAVSRAVDRPAEPGRHTPVVHGSQRDDESEEHRSMLFMVPMYLAGSLITSFVFGIALIATMTAVIVLLNELG